MIAVVWPPTVTSTYRDLVNARHADHGPAVAALLAAGSGSRFDGPTHKLLAPLDGRPVWHHALLHACSAGYDLVIVVEGAVGLGALPSLPSGSSPVMVVPNPDWSAGQATSVRVAVDTATAQGARHLTIGLADQPSVTTEAWTAVRLADPDCRIVVADYPTGRGPHPVRFDRSLLGTLRELDGDDGARHLLRTHPEWVCAVHCVGSGTDIDTLEDLHRWNSC
jgi:molybdenum cofactor cytidylyltransferase